MKKLSEKYSEIWIEKNIGHLFKEKAKAANMKYSEYIAFLLYINEKYNKIKNDTE